MKQKTNSRGRPKGTGKYGVETKPIRVPVALLEKIKQLIKQELG